MSDHRSRGALRLSGSHVAVCHTVLGLGSFVSALVFGLWFHYKKIVKNQYHGYPQEWWPSVSATIGDWYPERSVFQILIAFASGPRLLLLALFYISSSSSFTSSSLPKWTVLAGFIRTLMCAGWVYITSTDDHDWHDIYMISYMVLTIPWMYGCTTLTAPSLPHIKKRRILVAGTFFGTIVPLIYLFIQHKVHRVAGAYSKYAICEWTLVFSDVIFDSLTSEEFSRFKLTIDLGGTGEGMEKGARTTMPKQQRVKEEAVRILSPNEELGKWLAEAYLAFCWWTGLTALGPMIFYWSTWSLSLSGWEALLFVTLSPVFLLFPPLRRLVIRNIRPLRFISFLPILLAYNITEDPMLRLQVVALGNFGTCMALAAEWYGYAGTEEGKSRSITWALGLLVHVVIKIFGRSLNPVWPFMRVLTGGWNNLGLFFFLLASAVDLYIPSPPPRRGTGERESIPRRTYRTITSALGLGSLIFALHTFTSDSGTLLIWGWTGYPINGPVILPHSALTVVFMSLGIYLSLSTPHPLTFLLGAGGATALYKLEGWWSYLGGLLFALRLLSWVPAFVEAAAMCSPLSLALAWLVYNVLVLANVWTVAYAFVPGGEYLRESSGTILVIMLVFMAVGFRPVFSLRKGQRSWASYAPSRTFKKVITRTNAFVTVSSLLAICTVFYRLHSLDVPTPYHPEQKMLTAGIWTIHFGLDGFGRESQRRMRDLIKDMELDVVGLLESDLQRVVNGNRDLTQFLSEDLGMYVDYGPPPNKHTWGATLLSKFPILNSTHILLPSPHGELAPAIHATLDVYGTLVDVIVAHNGQEEDPEDRRLQSEELGRRMAEVYPRPLLFLGYVITRPSALKPDPYFYFLQDGKMLDVEPADWDRWCEYIFFRGLHRIGYARVTRGSNPSITDTELQVIKLLVPDKPLPPGHISYHKVDEAEIPLPYRFPRTFKGFGHEYHVLGAPNPKPYYYAIQEVPEDSQAGEKKLTEGS
ncbi:hypothetical protein BT69DRAFT_1349992 [Atractiella rhizophila]|nr:hypothetical protein BT69DRAFT_1349992 [Atractiella rhizophila]